MQVRRIYTNGTWGYSSLIGSLRSKVRVNAPIPQPSEQGPRLAAFATQKSWEGGPAISPLLLSEMLFGGGEEEGWN